MVFFFTPLIRAVSYNTRGWVEVTFHILQATNSDSRHFLHLWPCGGLWPHCVLCDARKMPSRLRSSFYCL